MTDRELLEGAEVRVIRVTIGHGQTDTVVQVETNLTSDFDGPGWPHEVAAALQRLIDGFLQGGAKE